MAKSYPADLQARIIEFVAAGNSRREAARHFSVSPSFVVKLLQKGGPIEAPAAPKGDEPAAPAQPDLPNLVVSGPDLADLLGVSRRSINEFAERGIVDRVSRNRFSLQRSIKLYSEHLRTVAAGRGGDGSQELTIERARLAREQADATALKNQILRREIVQVADVEREWSTVCRKIRNALLAVTSRVRQTLPHLTAYDVAQIDREIRDSLTDLGRDDDEPAAAPPSCVAELDAATKAPALGVD